MLPLSSCSLPQSSPKSKPHSHPVFAEVSARPVCPTLVLFWPSSPFQATIISGLHAWEVVSQQSNTGFHALTKQIIHQQNVSAEHRQCDATSHFACGNLEGVDVSACIAALPLAAYCNKSGETHGRTTAPHQSALFNAHSLYWLPLKF